MLLVGECTVAGTASAHLEWTRINVHGREVDYRELRGAGPSARLRRTQAGHTACCSLALGTHLDSASNFLYTNIQYVV